MGLEDTNHTLSFTNLGIGYLSQFDMDYMIVNSTTDPDAIKTTPPSNPSSNTTVAADASVHSSSAPVGAIAGGAAGGVVALALLGAFIWWFLRRRPRKAGSTHHVDLMGVPNYGGEEVKPFSYPQGSGTSSLDPSPQSTPYKNPFSQAGYSDSALASSTGEQAREPDLTAVPFLSRVPPPPASTASSYARTVNRSAASTSGRISEMGAAMYSPSELGGLAAIGEHFVNRSTASASAAAPASSASSRRGQSGSEAARANPAAPQQPLRLVAPIELHEMGTGISSPEGTTQSSTLYSPPTSTMLRNEKSAAIILSYTAHSRRSSSPTTTLSASEVSNNRLNLPRAQQAGPHGQGVIAEEVDLRTDHDQPPPPDYHQATRPHQDHLPPGAAAAQPDAAHGQ